jgi:hypothetical protein
MSQQELISQLSQFVSAAYGAFSVTATNANSPDAPPITPQQAILQYQRNLTNIQPIYVYESLPNVNPFTDVDPFAVASKAKKFASAIIPDQNRGYNPSAYASGYQLFGYTATLLVDGVPTSNIIALRGTVTPQEAFASLTGWDSDLTPCNLPTNSDNPTQQGCVNPSYWKFYQEEGGEWEASLAQSIQTAILATVSASDPSLPWYGAAHSLGGGMLSVGIYDALLAGCFPKGAVPTVVTFGSVVIGNDIFAGLYNQAIPKTFRVTNLCDFVPSLKGLTPGPPAGLYTHVGIGYLFVWQKDSDWDNHSLDNVYMLAVGSTSSFSNVYIATSGPPPYPVGIEKFGNTVG